MELDEKEFIYLGRYHDASPNPVADASSTSLIVVSYSDKTSSMIGTIAQISLRLDVKSGV